MGLRQWKGEAVAVLLCVLAMMFMRVVTHIVEYESIYLDEQGKVLVEDGNTSESALAHRTQRADPLDGLKKYRGGFNITDKHYWSSTILTGKFGYMIAVAWLFGGLTYASILIISCISFCFKGRSMQKRPISLKITYNWPLFFAALLTSLAIIASGVALEGSNGFRSRAMAIENIVAEAANNASGTIHTVTETVEMLQNDTQFSKNVEGSRSLNLTTKKLDDVANNIETKAKRIMQGVRKGLDILNAVTVISVTLNLVTVLALLASVPFRLHRTFCILIVLCWLLTFLLWAYYGLYYFFGKLAGDTCMALGEYCQNPENSTLSTVLPCNDHISAETFLHHVGARFYYFIQQVNSNITYLRSSLSGLQYVCNPFSGPPEYEYQPENCSSEAIRIGDIPNIIERFACLGSSSGTCKPGEFIPASIYGKLQLYSDSMQDILDSYPRMKSLVSCQLVKDAFSDILFDHCQPLKKHVHMSWASLATLSIITVFLILVYVSEAHHMIELQSSDESVKPHSELTGPSKVDGAELVSSHQQQNLQP